MTIKTVNEGHHEGCSIYDKETPDGCSCGYTDRFVELDADTPVADVLKVVHIQLTTYGLEIVLNDIGLDRVGWAIIPLEKFEKKKN